MKEKITVREITIFSMLGAIMYVSKVLMEFLPNVHLIGIFTISLTLVYREKALFPIYTFVMLTGLFNGFNLWWIPYLYLWTILFGMTMLLPKNIKEERKPLIYASICSLHGFLFGTLYAPAQALMFGLTFKGMIAWIIAGLPWDAIHGVSNFIGGFLIVPLTKALKMAEKSLNRS